MKIKFLPITLIITTCLIFAVTFSFAQKEKDKTCRMVIKIQKDDGVTHIDTTIIIDDCDEIMHGNIDFDEDFDFDINISEDFDFDFDFHLDSILENLDIDMDEGGNTNVSINIHAFIKDDDKNSDISIVIEGDEGIYIFKGKSIKIIVRDLNSEEKKDLNEKIELNENNDLKINKIKFYPNPNSGKFILDFNLEDEGPTAIRIFDMKGNIVFEEEMTNFKGNYNKEIDLSGEGKGIYILKVIQGDKHHSKKIVVK